MKILIIITKGEIGGAQKFVLDLAKTLFAKGEQITVACGEGDYLPQELGFAGIPCLNFKWLKRSHNPWAMLFFIRELKNHINRNAYDIVHFNSYNALLGALSARLSQNKPKTIFTLHGLSFLNKNYQALKLLKWLYGMVFRFLFNLTGELIFVCQADFEYAKQTGLTKKGKVIYNGINQSELAFLPKAEAIAGLENKFGLNLRDKIVLGSIGRLAYPKNYEFVLNLLPKILEFEPKARLVIFGDGPEKIKYLSLAEKRRVKDKVHFLGGFADAPRYLKAFDVFLLPSVYEGLPMTALEAMAAGLPVLVSKVGGSFELVNSQEQAYNLSDSEEFLSKLRQLIKDKNRASKLGEQNMSRARQFNLADEASSYLKAYSNLLKT